MVQNINLPIRRKTTRKKIDLRAKKNDKKYNLKIKQYKIN